MQWFGGRESDNVEEGSSSGGGRGLFLGGGALGLIGVLVYLFTGVNVNGLFNSGQPDQSQQQNHKISSANLTTDQRFASVIFASTEDVWTSLFNDMSKTYTSPTLHFFTDGVDAQGCGFASSATGPFYCPADRKVYIDLAFFDELSNRFQSPGEAAKAYVIAHEVGHHVQNLLGLSAKVDAARQQLSQTEFNKLSVKLELQADFYAGVWAHYVQQARSKGVVINRADIDSALTAAHAIGDDRLQQQSTGHIEPDSFTHGTSAQRAYWFKKGFDTGDVRQGNTFGKREEDSL
ncbi:zinc metallopeptidase [Mucilaginibacter mali]|uniref:Zinc metallopeptidase n=1 Tax=Mucilaginibacter mali TaxID=2740462 RepID=A0A7D4UGP2_9SPHI|nr:neutral zinc metallopeptidase [Mucilaginibacter mali]QKJ32076.1 zinc metallopeptidase [Mucilaginibacter mali]